MKTILFYFVYHKQLFSFILRYTYPVENLELDSRLTSRDLALVNPDLRVDHGSLSSPAVEPPLCKSLNFALSASSECSLQSLKHLLHLVGHLTWGWNPRGHRGSDDLPQVAPVLLVLTGMTYDEKCQLLMKKIITDVNNNRHTFVMYSLLIVLLLFS